MSVIDLSVAKDQLDVVHDMDDEKLQLLLDGAESEASDYMNVSTLEAAFDSNGQVPGGVLLGVMLLLQAAYQAAPAEIGALRSAAEKKLAPYRCGWGA